MSFLFFDGDFSLVIDVFLLFWCFFFVNWFFSMIGYGEVNVGIVKVFVLLIFVLEVLVFFFNEIEGFGSWFMFDKGKYFSGL